MFLRCYIPEICSLEAGGARSGDVQRTLEVLVQRVQQTIGESLDIVSVFFTLHRA